MNYGVLIDLDQTLVDSSALKALRDAREWKKVQATLRLSRAYDSARLFLTAIEQSQFPYGIVTSAPRSYAESLVRHHGLNVSEIGRAHV